MKCTPCFSQRERYIKRSSQGKRRNVFLSSYSLWMPFQPMKMNESPENAPIDKGGLNHSCNNFDERSDSNDGNGTLIVLVYPEVKISNDHNGWDGHLLPECQETEAVLWREMIRSLERVNARRTHELLCVARQYPNKEARYHSQHPSTPV
jgi:hypothetical protein